MTGNKLKFESSKVSKKILSSTNFRVPHKTRGTAGSRATLFAHEKLLNTVSLRDAKLLHILGFEIRGGQRLRLLRRACDGDLDTGHWTPGHSESGLADPP